MRALVHAPDHQCWYVYEHPERTITADDTSTIHGLLADIERETRDNSRYAVIALRYEAAPAFDSHYLVNRPSSVFPLFYCALYRERRRVSSIEEACMDPHGDCETSAFVPAIARDTYLGKIDRIKDRLASGDSYQVNYTFTLRARYRGNPFAWFCDRVKKKPGAYTAFLDCGEEQIASLSPELFFSRSAVDAHTGVSSLLFKPMKGTAAVLPGMSGHEIDTCARELAADEKNRSENLMIVDMIRNDAGRIAVAGSVTVHELFATEKYPTLIQMTSTVSALTKHGLADIFAAVFPCASITGAPKIRSMDIIAELEDEARGMYTGAIGRLDPDGSALFNVAIRTAVFDTADRSVAYGCGSGIVWPSVADAEYDECMTKTAVLQNPAGFYVFDSLCARGGLCELLDRHIERLRDSSCAFYFTAFPEEDIREALVRSARRYPSEVRKIRTRLYPDGHFDIDNEEPPALPTPYTIDVTPAFLDADDVFVRHKTSVRSYLEEAKRQYRETGMSQPADLIMVNTRGELTETLRGNVVLELDGTLVTPPLTSGALPGTMRAELLERGELCERIVYPDDFRRASRVLMINSVRGAIDCVKKG